MTSKPRQSTARTSTRSAAAQDQDKPAKIFMNLDTLEREGELPEPYGFMVGGRPYVLTDAQEVDWQDLAAAMQDPVNFFRKALPAAEAARFLATRIPGWKMQQLIKGYLEHFGLGIPGE